MMLSKTESGKQFRSKILDLLESIRKGEWLHKSELYEVKRESKVLLIKMMFPEEKLERIKYLRSVGLTYSEVARLTNLTGAQVREISWEIGDTFLSFKFMSQEKREMIVEELLKGTKGEGKRDWADRLFEAMGKATLVRTPYDSGW